MYRMKTINVVINMGGGPNLRLHNLHGKGKTKPGWSGIWKECASSNALNILRRNMVLIERSFHFQFLC